MKPLVIHVSNNRKSRHTFVATFVKNGQIESIYGDSLAQMFRQAARHGITHYEEAGGKVRLIPKKYRLT